MVRQGSTQQQCLKPPWIKMLETPEPQQNHYLSGWHRAVAALAVNKGRTWIHALTHWPSQPTA